MRHSLLVDGFFCFGLQTGAVLIGWIGFISAFFSIIGLSLSYDDIDGFIKELNITNGKEPSEWTDDDINFMRHLAVSLITIFIGFYILEALASLFLIHGVSSNKRFYLVPWILGKSVHLLYQVIIWLGIGFYFFTSKHTIGLSIITFVVGGLVIFFYFYCFMCVYSIFVMMREVDEYQRLLNGSRQSQPPPSYGHGQTTFVKI